MEYYSTTRENEILSFVTRGVDLKSIMLSEKSQRKINTVLFAFYVESKTKQTRLTDTENKLMVVSGEGVGDG